MADNTQALVIGLSAGLGGFAGLLIVCCICWNLLCGTWCESKPKQLTTIPISTKNQRRIPITNKVHSTASNITDTKTTIIHSNSKLSSSHDLASKVNSARR